MQDLYQLMDDSDGGNEQEREDSSSDSDSDENIEERGTALPWRWILVADEVNNWQFFFAETLQKIRVCLQFLHDIFLNSYSIYLKFGLVIAYFTGYGMKQAYLDPIKLENFMWF